MEPVSMNDGLDGRETIAFGLGAAEVAALVLALLAAYAALHTGLPVAVGWVLAALLALAGAALGWGRLAGRSLLEWGVLLARFAVRSHLARLRLPATAARAAQDGAVVLSLALRPHRAATDRRYAPSAATPGVHVFAFFSLNGGSGRTTLAVEVASLLAVRGAADRAAGAPGFHVALLDLTTRSPAVALRLGIPLLAMAGAATAPPAPPAPAIHSTGLLVFPAGAGQPDGGVTSARALLESAGRAGARILVVDLDCDLGELCAEVLRRCERVFVTVAPTAGGVLDAYRSTAALARLGFRDRLEYVLNRCGTVAGMAEVMDDLGGTVVAAIPEDPALVEAENTHRLAAMESSAACARPLATLAAHVEQVAGGAAALGNGFGNTGAG